MSDPLSLAEALEKQKRDSERRLMRGVRAFANRMRLAAFGAVAVGGLLTLAAQAWGRAYDLAWSGNIMLAILVLTWAYAAALLGIFWWRTRFGAHVLKNHWTWLAVLVGIPIDVFQAFYARRRVPAWLLLILAGSLFWRWRTIRAEEEIRAHAPQWEQLFRMSWNGLLLMRFPAVRAESEAEL
jgi:hypothetical protein